MMAGLLIPVVLIAGAGTVEYTNAVEWRRAAQSIADSAALVAATRDADSAEKLFRQQIGGRGGPSDIIQKLVVSSVDGTGTVEADLNLKGFFSSIGLGGVPVTISSAAEVGGQTALDVVLSLDYSGSMNADNKFGRMAKAATTFLETFEGSEDTVRVGIVPFAGEVLMGIDGRYLFDMYSGGSLLGASYLACVGNRGYPSAVQIDTPSNALDSSLWPANDFASLSAGGGGDAGTWAVDTATSDWGDPPPWLDGMDGDVEFVESGEYLEFSDGTGEFVPDGASPKSGQSVTSTSFSYRENRTGGGRTWVWASQISTLCDDQAAWEAGMCGPPPDGPEYAGTSTATTPGSEDFVSDSLATHQASENLAPACKELFDRELLTRPLTTDLASLKGNIANMTPSGMTNISLAFDVAWHVISDNAPWIEGAEVPDADRVVILLTDGVQTVPAVGSGDELSISAANRNSAELCTAMKADSVTVYTVAFGIDDTFTRDLLKGCATSLSHYFEPGASESLDSVFAAIAASLATPARIVR